MLKLKFSKTFKKAFKKITNQEQEIFYQVAEQLLKQQPLDKKYKDHALTGNFKDFRECHLKPDLLLIYQVRNQELVLYCFDIGSHSDLFK